ncbi:MULTISPECIES: glycosyltransferase family 9 protein [unclassified Achromobacter]|uniref:glycosyltransferase family 9 protein n=1 Tax=unclassified Achromobacter TaxID=2626865 RepID=UPI000B519968|nr:MULTISPECIES: glycosyltransferase family 9 protein [unclassified Achromobacter]OWT70117.1 heptosyltransferase [Achromobacter sp. HZ34]OWT71656.1 heptosyltransferase [Achromobacter sp. HZ28]
MPSNLRLYVRLPNWVGDVCMSLPSLYVLQATGLPLTICARPWARDLLAGVAPAHDFVPMRGAFRADRAALRQHVRDSGARGRDCRGLSLPDSLSSAAVLRLAGIPTAGYRDDGRSLLLHWPIAKPKAPLHAVQSWYHLTRTALAAWGLPAGAEQPGPELGLTPTAEQAAAADAALAAAGLADTGVDANAAAYGTRASGDQAHDGMASAATIRPFVLIAPTATGLHRGRNKVWPHFDTLTRNLQAQGIEVVMCPPPAEVDEARRNAPTARLLPALGLGAFAALTTRAALVVCNDSGVSHVAAAAGARQITLFGVTNRERTGPWSRGAICLGSDEHWPAVSDVAPVIKTCLESSGQSACFTD